MDDHYHHHHLHITHLDISNIITRNAAETVYEKYHCTSTVTVKCITISTGRCCFMVSTQAMAKWCISWV